MAEAEDTVDEDPIVAELRKAEEAVKSTHAAEVAAAEAAKAAREHKDSLTQTRDSKLVADRHPPLSLEPPQLAEKYGIGLRQVQRILKRAGVRRRNLTVTTAKRSNVA